jgi:hypothetical protein
MGMWLPVHGEEWDGDVPLGLQRAPSGSRDTQYGSVTFKGNTLPWLVGRYEVRLLPPSQYLLSSDCELDSLPPRWEVQRHELRRAVGNLWSVSLLKV